MTKGNIVNDIAFQFTGAQSVGPDTATATGAFYGRVDGNTRLDFDAGSGMKTECHLITDGRRELYRRDAAGTVTKGALHAAWISNMWLAPPLALSRVLQDPEYKFVYGGRQSWNGQPVEQITIFIDESSEKPDSETLIEKLSSVELFLDATTLLPVRVTYNVYSDKTFSQSLPLELQFNNYSPDGGVLFAHKIAAFFNYGPWRLYQISALQINAGIADATFNLAGGIQ
jgi:hypothetical protein